MAESAWLVHLEAAAPPEARGLRRDEVRLLVSDSREDRHLTFLEMPDVLRSGDLLVVNRSATLPASLPALGAPGPFLLNLSTAYGRNIWLAEPRWAWDRPGPVPLADGERFIVAGLRARRIAGYPGVPRLVFVRFEGDL
ncbi:MAG: S-adenosylmethionine:tRNA ribosyltransferase-isomerase, partial [Thermoplasmata archaeon]|nr:S-adenosylmethionine:tRNA ribosyltransferase-isomerase [Thermoplasmata archaeon]